MRGIHFFVITSIFAFMGFFQANLLKEIKKTAHRDRTVFIRKARQMNIGIVKRPSSYPMVESEKLLSDSLFMAEVNLQNLEEIEFFDKYNEQYEGENLILPADFFEEKVSKRKEKEKKKQSYRPPALKIPEGETYKLKDLNFTNQTEIRNKIITFGRTFMGLRYKWGGRTPKGFDCSGFTGYVFEQVLGINLPRTSHYQSKIGYKVKPEDAKAGDLIFFGYKRKGGAYRTKHTGIVTAYKDGKVKFIHSSRRGIIEENVEDSRHYRKRFLFIKRVF